MTTLSALVDRVRMELADTPKLFEQELTSDGTTNTFQLNFSPLLAASLTVHINDIPVPDNPVAEVPYSGVAVDEASGLLVFDFTPAEGDTIRVTGTHFRFFTDSELESVINDSTAMHVGSRTDHLGRPITLARLDGIEEYPLALLGTINALYVLATDASFDIDIYAPDGVNIPRSQRYRQLMEMIEALKAHYKELCALLNIGMHKIEVFTLRRISKRTNRYVPIYRPKEFDDRSAPVRVRLEIPGYGGDPIEDNIPDLDLTMYQGDTFSQVLPTTIAVPEGAVLTAQIRSYAGGPLVADYVVTWVDEHTLTLSLSAAKTTLTPRNALWDMQMVYEGATQTLFRGTVFTERQVTI